MNLSSEQSELMQRISAHLDPHLKEGRTYHQEIYKSEHGSSGGSVFLMYEGKSYTQFNERQNPDNPITAGLKAVDTVIRDMRGNLNVSDLYRNLPADTKIRLTYTKGQPMEMLVLEVPHLIADLKKEIKEDALRYASDDSEFVKSEAIIRFLKQEDELGVYTDQTTVLSTETTSDSSPADTNLIRCLHKALGGIEKLYYKLEDDVLTLQSEPAFPEFAIEKLDAANENIELEPEYKKRKDAQQEAIQIRTAFYNTLGTVLPVPIYLSVGGFRSNSWPEGSHYHTSEVLRVIYTKDSTIVITDGLSDVYSSSSSDVNLEYNGIGAEMYIEFDGHITYGDIRKHFCVALLNSVTQIAIEHGDFKALINNNDHLTIEFREENVELWCVKGDMRASNGIGTFFRPGQYAGDDFGAFINMPSKSVPAKLRLNQEEILLVNVKPFTNEWLTSYKLRTEEGEEAKKQVRLEMMEKFEASGEGNRIPLTYVEEGADNTLGEIFPLSDVEPRHDEINMELIERMASSEELSEEALQGMLDAHNEFLNAGGNNGRFEQLYTASLPLNIYMTGTKAGKQFKPGMNTIPKNFSLGDKDLRSSEFTACIADGVNFSGATLSGSLLTNGYFRGANFENADLADVDFTGSDLTGANFKNANLDGADFEISNLTGADFTGANTTDATFTGANITDVKY
jgi:uncharacterized protein YjbI with pentapeptide repeats